LLAATAAVVVVGCFWDQLFGGSFQNLLLLLLLLGVFGISCLVGVSKIYCCCCCCWVFLGSVVWWVLPKPVVVFFGGGGGLFN
jgi:hypothetical protein